MDGQTNGSHHLNPYERPPESIRNVYKKFQKMYLNNLARDHEILDFENATTAQESGKVSVKEALDHDDPNNHFQMFAGNRTASLTADREVSMYECRELPGLFIIPSLLPPEIQLLLLSRLFHRDLSKPVHLTNIHTHYTLNYPPDGRSFFHTPPSSSKQAAIPHDPSIHRPLSIKPLLNRKLRWMTLGGQYNWTEKKYPDTSPPEFPEDIKALLEGIFPKTRSEAAIVNLYSPGDTLSLHRDVAEHCGKGLISVSLGCDAIFIIGNTVQGTTPDEAKDNTVVLRLRSGDAVYMSGESRFAWHGVPQILKDTCPEYLRDWPGGDSNGEFEEWRGWMASKRVNVNVRQMFD